MTIYSHFISNEDFLKHAKEIMKEQDAFLEALPQYRGPFAAQYEDGFLYFTLSAQPLGKAIMSAENDLDLSTTVDRIDSDLYIIDEGTVCGTLYCSDSNSGEEFIYPLCRIKSPSETYHDVDDELKETD